MNRPRLFKFAALAVLAVLLVGLGAGLAARRGQRAFRTDNASWLRQLAADGAVRLYALPDVANIRDCGGWKTADGRRVRFGRLFRSGELNNTDARRAERHFTLAASSRAFFADTLGIRTDIDLRSDSECAGMTGSPLGTNVVWHHAPYLAYARLDTPQSRKAFAGIFRALLDARAYPALVHCRAGRDRAGTVVFLLNALLGVPERDLRRDWELSERLPRNAFFNYGRVEGIFEALAAYPGETVNARAAAFVRSLGFTDADLARFRALMLEDRAP